MLRDRTCWRILGAVMLVAAMVGLVPQVGAANRYKTLHRFTGQDGTSPRSDLILDALGNLYGTTVSGGTSNRGTVFKLTPQLNGTWREVVLYDFCSKTNCSDGDFPVGRLTFDQSGDLYGATEVGGTHNAGVVFRLTQRSDRSWTQQVLHSFNGVDGSSPLGGLVFDQTGNLYGITALGGGHAGGVAFRLTPNLGGRWTARVLYNFCSVRFCRDGQNPVGGLVFDQAGNLYGATDTGGPTSCGECGLVFELRPNPDGSWTERVIYRFRFSDGAAPAAGLIFDGTGNLFGTTEFGGAFQHGTVFELMPNQQGGWKVKVLHDFTGGIDGGESVADLTFDGAGNLYGTTQYGGDVACSGGCGVVFKLVRAQKGNWPETVLHQFHDRPGATPYAGVIFDVVGNLYGTTGGYVANTVYQITP